jgi:hypothetical protein
MAGRGSTGATLQVMRRKHGQRCMALPGRTLTYGNARTAGASPSCGPRGDTAESRSEEETKTFAGEGSYSSMLPTYEVYTRVGSSTLL